MTSKTRAVRLLQLALQTHKLRQKHIGCDIREQVNDDDEKSLYCVPCKRQFNYQSWYRRHMITQLF